MVNESSTGRALLVVLLLVAVFQPGVLNASAHFMSLKSAGMLASPAFEQAENKDNPAEKASFFGTLGPDASAKGAVKTFIIKIGKRHNNESIAKDSENFSIVKADRAETGSKGLLRPVVGRISSLFGRRRHPRSHSWHFHTGVDIVAPRGTPIFSSQGGKVSYAGWRRGYGLVVVVDHGNNLQTAYAHCSRINVKVGQSVSAAQRIALVGSTGVTTGTHLHFEVRRNGSVENPLRYLSL